MRKGWKRASLGDLGKCINGLTYSPTDVTDSTGLLVLRSSNVQNGKLSFDDNVYVTKLVAKESLTKEGDILVCVRNGSKNLIGKNCLITKEASGNAHGAFMTLFRSQNPEFVYQLLQTDRYYNQVRRNLGATINSINTSDFYEFTFDIPPLPEQHKIATILRTWDNAIEKNQFLKTKLLRKQQALAAIFFSSNSPEARCVALGDVCSPKQWATISKNDLTESGVPVFGANGYLGYYSSANHAHDTIAITCRGATCGEVNWVPGPAYITGNAMCLDDIDTRQVNQRFLWHLLRHRGLKEIISGSAQPQIVGTDIRSVKIHVPPLHRQQVVTSVLDQQLLEIELLERQTQTYKSQKRGLMQKLLTGEWRVVVDVQADSKEMAHA